MAGRGLNPPSLVLPTIDARRGAHRWPAWLALGIIGALFVVFATTAPVGDDPRIRNLAGTWDATLPDGARTPLRVPGTFRAQGLNPDGRVFASTPVVATGEALALWIDEPRYACTVTWDGVPITSVGDPDGAARSSNPIFVVLPTGPDGEVHQLGLDIQGDYGEGGLRGHVLVGPVAQVHHAASTWRMRALATAIGVAMLGALPLLVASRGPARPSYTTFGLAAAALAVLLWTLTPQPAARSGR